VDPPPEMIFERLWQVLVTGLAPNERVIAKDKQGNVIASASPSSRGMAHLSALFASDTSDAAASSDELELALQQAASAPRMLSLSARMLVQGVAPMPAAAAAADSRQLLIKQILLARE